MSTWVADGNGSGAEGRRDDRHQEVTASIINTTLNALRTTTMRNLTSLKRGETTSASDSAKYNVVVLMIPDIADIISAGNDNDGSGCGHGWR